MKTKSFTTIGKSMEKVFKTLAHIAKSTESMPEGFQAQVMKLYTIASVFMDYAITIDKQLPDDFESSETKTN